MNDAWRLFDDRRDQTQRGSELKWSPLVYELQVSSATPLTGCQALAHEVGGSFRGRHQYPADPGCIERIEHVMGDRLIGDVLGRGHRQHLRPWANRVLDHDHSLQIHNEQTERTRPHSRVGFIESSAIGHVGSLYRKPTHASTDGSRALLGYIET